MYTSLNFTVHKSVQLHYWVYKKVKGMQNSRGAQDFLNQDKRKCMWSDQMIRLLSFNQMI